ncbi:MAG TPA: M20/M25/M40 family metallo-hydrolase [Polyangiaceae bacterium]|nr:M20/M25/M40 family metallo-hydrolase [Polyangiaceae bacterium]
MPPAIDWAEATEEAVRHLKALLRIDTTNPPGNERPAADYLARALAAEGIEHALVESAPGRANLVARLRGRGGRGALLLNGHLDVVPAERARWTHDPFGAVEEGGYIWGRGALDMKNMVAMALTTLALLKRTGAALGRDVVFAAVADEEAGARAGSLFLCERHPELVRAEYVLGEVGGHTLHLGGRRYYPVQVAEKGVCWFEMVAEGEPGHGSMPHPHNAVVRLSRAVAALGAVRLPQRAHPVVENFLRTVARGAKAPERQLMPLLLEPRLAGHLLRLLERAAPSKAKGLNAMLRDTASPTGLEAGAKVNVIPASARARVDGRMMPGQTVQAFLDEVRRVVGPGVALNVIEAHEGVAFPADTPLYDAIRATLARHDPEGEPVPYMIPGFTDAFAYAKLGAVCYGFSPVRLGPDLDFASLYHGHDERIPREGFAWGLRVLYELVRDFCAA